MKRAVVVIAVLFLFVTIARAADPLRVVSAGPSGEIASLAEANEIRVTFSEPMIVVGRVPEPVVAPFFHIDPAAKGSFRWAGTTTLIFTPNANALPFATKYDVTIDRTAKSVAGNTLDRDYSFSFTTPTVKLLRTNWYLTPKRSVVIGLWFNQPVNPDVILQHLQLRTTPHPFEQPAIPPAGVARLKQKEPQALQAFEEKKARAAQAASAAAAPILSFRTDDYDRKKLGSIPPPQVVVETKPGIPPDTWIQLAIDGKLAQRPGNVPTGAPQEYVIQLPPAFFVAGLSCESGCDPERYNAVRFRGGELSIDDVRKAVSVIDITDPAGEVVLPPQKVDRDFDYPSSEFALDALGYSLRPARRYAVRVDPSLPTDDGQTLGYAWMGTIENWHRTAFISFGDGEGVWESTGGPLLPFHARNYRSVKQWLEPISLEQTMPLLLDLKKNGFKSTPKGEAANRKLNAIPDKIQSFGLDIRPATGSDGHGLIWAAMKPGDPIPQSAAYDTDTRATIVQVTNLGISVKDSPQNAVVLVTALDTGLPVSGANVSIRTTDNKVFWTGVTDEHGLAVAPATNLRAAKKKKKDDGADEWERSWQAVNQLHFIVSAEKDGDVAYVGSDWNEGIEPWSFDGRFDINEANPLLRGTIFTDRGVYKLGEEVHFKAIVRSDTPAGMQLLPAGTKVDVALTDAHAKEIDKRTLALNEWSSAEWTFTLPADAPLGTYNVAATVKSQRLGVGGEFLVAAYRRPDFRVDTTLTAPGSIAGVTLDGTITGRYLHGGAMQNPEAKWTYSKIELLDVPSAVTDRFPEERYSFLGRDWEQSEPSRITIQQKEETLGSDGVLKLQLDTELKAGAPYEYELEGDVTDVTRQHIAGRASFRVDPAPWYVGLKTPPYFADAAKGADTEVVAVGLNGSPVAGVKVELNLVRIQWNSVRKATGNGFYEWETERKEIASGEWPVVTKSEPVPLHIPLSSGGQYRLTAVARDGEGRSTTTRVWFYAVGAGYTAWERYDHNRIDLVPEKKTYKPGDTARIMIKSPWEKATALLTTEREGVRTWQQFNLTSTQQTVTVPITEKEIPNVFVSVLLVKGRTKEAVTEDASDPGKPAFRLGYVELSVEDAAKRLKVNVKANRDEYRPASKAKIDVSVADAAGKPSQSEVTLWAVDYGVLSLTAYQTPDVLKSIYLNKALQVVNDDSRQKIVSRRVLTPKGAGEGGGGGRDTGPGTMRKDFRVLAFWLGSVVTDANGRANTEVTIPESLTTYRIMAVAGDRQSRFGWAQNEIKVNKPLMLTPAFPRFMTPGDKAYFGGVVHSQKISGNATVTIRSLDPTILDFPSGKSSVKVTPGSSNEVRFDAVAKTSGTARVQMRVNIGRENDAFQDTIPVRVLVSPETVAASGEAKPQARETLAIPANVVPGFGGLQLQLASTAMVGLGEGANYLVDYPYGCAEQRSSAALALLLASDLGDAFRIGGIDAKETHAIAQKTLTELDKFQCGDGGFAYWPGDCGGTSPYLTSYVLHVYQRGDKLGYKVDRDVMKRAYEYLERSLNEQKPANESWWPAFTAWQAFSVKVLAEGGRNVDSHISRLYGYRDRLPLFGISYLADALIAKGEKGARLDELHRRLTNAILPEASEAHVEELSDPYLLWFWNSNVRSTAIVMGNLVRQGSDEQLVKQMVRWLMRVRKGGRWGNTQENAWAMESLVDYYRKYEAETPDFSAVVTAGTMALAKDEFRGRSTEAKAHDIPMQQLQSMRAAAPEVPVTFERQGTGTLFYQMRLRYASLERDLKAMNQGFAIERTYRVNGETAAATAFDAGDLIEVTLKLRNTKERRFVALTDPVPAGTEPVETAFATTAQELVEQQQQQTYSWRWWERGGFDHVERHDDRVNVFATRLDEGDHEFKYLLRATTAGTFLTAPAHVEEMYEPEVFGRTASTVMEVKR